MEEINSDLKEISSLIEKISQFPDKEEDLNLNQDIFQPETSNEIEKQHFQIS